MNISLVKARLGTISFQSLKSLPKYCYATDAKDIVTELEVEDVPKYDAESKYDEEEIERLRDISGLRIQQHNKIHGRKPYEQNDFWINDTVWYRKKLLGTYGIEAAECSPAICWPTKQELEDWREYEKIEYPDSIQTLWKKFEEEKKEEKEAILKRDKEIDEGVAKLDQWRAKLEAKILAKESALFAAKQKKERALDEIREQFGFKVDPKDERFQELMAQKEKEDKKKKREEKKKLKHAKMMELLMKKEKAATDASGEQTNSEDTKKELSSVSDSVTKKSTD